MVCTDAHPLGDRTEQRTPFPSAFTCLRVRVSVARINLFVSLLTFAKSKYTILLQVPGDVLPIQRYKSVPKLVVPSRKKALSLVAFRTTTDFAKAVETKQPRSARIIQSQPSRVRPVSQVGFVFVIGIP